MLFSTTRRFDCDAIGVLLHSAWVYRRVNCVRTGDVPNMFYFCSEFKQKNDTS